VTRRVALRNIRSGVSGGIDRPGRSAAAMAAAAQCDDTTFSQSFAPSVCSIADSEQLSRAVAERERFVAQSTEPDLL
jgi:hypothetical protein